MTTQRKPDVLSAVTLMEMLEDAHRALADAERIIESRSGKGSWVGSLVLARVAKVLAVQYEEE